MSHDSAARGTLARASGAQSPRVVPPARRPASDLQREIATYQPLHIGHRFTSTIERYLLLASQRLVDRTKFGPTLTFDLIAHKQHRTKLWLFLRENVIGKIIVRQQLTRQTQGSGSGFRESQGSNQRLPASCVRHWSHSIHLLSTGRYIPLQLIPSWLLVLCNVVRVGSLSQEDGRFQGLSVRALSAPSRSTYADRLTLWCVKRKIYSDKLRLY